MGRMMDGPSTHFAKLVKMVKDHNSDECLMWPFSRDKNGYGVVQFQGRATRAHRVAYHLEHGRFAKPCTLHMCDNPPCFNPKHLYSGSNKDNARDRVDRGHQPRGERQGLSVLTAAQVLEIKRDYRYRQGGCSTLAKKYGVHPSTIHHALIGRTWRHLQ